jgi:CheY-like chemotaxis protein
MPLMDGEETFSRLREIRPDIPVMLATGFIQEERLERLKSVGLAGFVRKPIPPDELILSVQAILEFVKYSGGFVSGTL